MNPRNLAVSEVRAAAPAGFLSAGGWTQFLGLESLGCGSGSRILVLEGRLRGCGATERQQGSQAPQVTLTSLEGQREGHPEAELSTGKRASGSVF